VSKTLSPKNKFFISDLDVLFEPTSELNHIVSAGLPELLSKYNLVLALHPFLVFIHSILFLVFSTFSLFHLQAPSVPSCFLG